MNFGDGAPYELKGSRTVWVGEETEIISRSYLSTPSGMLSVNLTDTLTIDGNL